MVVSSVRFTDGVSYVARSVQPRVWCDRPPVDIEKCSNRSPDRALDKSSSFRVVGKLGVSGSPNFAYPVPEARLSIMP